MTTSSASAGDFFVEPLSPHPRTAPLRRGAQVTKASLLREVPPDGGGGSVHAMTDNFSEKGMKSPFHFPAIYVILTLYVPMQITA